MKRDNINYFAVGLFVIATFTVFLVTLTLITGRTGPADSYLVYYSNVAGIKYGTQVMFEGYPIGQVEGIHPEHRKGSVRYRLDLGVQEDWPVSRDSVASMVASGLLGTVSIDISHGASEELLEPGDEITGREAVSIFSALGDMATDLRSLSREGIRPLIDNLNARINNFADMLDNGVPDMQLQEG